MSYPKRKTQVDHWLSLSPEEQLRRNRKHYQAQIALRQHELNARNNMTPAQAWADKFGREPLPEDPDNLLPKGLSYEERASHKAYTLIQDPEQITQMQKALTERRLAVQASKTTKYVSKAKMLGNTSEE